MPAPSDKALLETQTFVDRCVALLEARGLRLTFEDDPHKWLAFMENAPGAPKTSRSVDGYANNFAPGEFFVIQLADEADYKFGTIGVRAIDTEDFVQEYVRTHKLFGNRVPSTNIYPLDLVLPSPKIEGRIAFSGGGWAHPVIRGTGSYTILSELSRVFALRHFFIDYHITFMEGTGNRRGWGAQTLGYNQSTPLLKTRYPGRDRPIDVDIYWMSHNQIIDYIEQSNSTVSQSGMPLEVVRKAG